MGVRVRRPLAGLLLLLLGAGAGAEVPKMAPDFVLPSVDGGNVRLSEYRGQAVVLTFWASWCGDCSEQLPLLDRLVRAHAARDVQLLVISLDAEPDTVAGIAAGLDAKVLLDPRREVVRRYDPGQLPVALFIDPHGRLRDGASGFRGRDLTHHEQALNRLLAELPPPIGGYR